MNKTITLTPQELNILAYLTFREAQQYRAPAKSVDDPDWQRHVDALDALHDKLVASQMPPGPGLKVTTVSATRKKR